jgi:hypothetical protein
MAIQPSSRRVYIGVVGFVHILFFRLAFRLTPVDLNANQTVSLAGVASVRLGVLFDQLIRALGGKDGLWESDEQRASAGVGSVTGRVFIEIR